MVRTFKTKSAAKKGGHKVKKRYIRAGKIKTAKKRTVKRKRKRKSKRKTKRK